MMALRKQVVSIPMESGIDAGKAPEIGGGFTKIQNGVFNRRNEISKRYGQNKSTATVDGNTLHPFGDSLVSAKSGEKLQIYTPASGTVTDITSHNVYFLEADYQPVLEGASGDANYIETIRSGTVLAIKTDDTITTKIGDAVVDSATFGTTKGTNGRFIIINDKIRCYWGISSAIQYVEIDAAGAIGSTVTVTDGSGSPPATSTLYDACVVTNSAGDPFVVLVWGAADYYISLLADGNNNASNVEVLNSAGGSLSSINGMSVAALTDTTFLVAWHSTTEVYAAVYDVTGTRTVAPPATTLASPIDNHFLGIGVIGLNVSSGGDVGTIYLTELESNSQYAIHEIDGIDSSSTYDANATNIYYNEALFAKPCPIGTTGEWLVAASVTSDTQYRGTDLQSMIVFHSAGTSTTMKLCGKALDGVAIGTARINSNAGNMIPAMHPWSGGICTLAAMRVNREPGNKRLDKQGYYGYKYSLISSGAYTLLNMDISHHEPTSVESDGLLLLSGMLPTLYDGEEHCEQGFITYPEDIEAADGGGSGSNWSYVATFEKTYATGHLERSIPTPEAVTISDVGVGTLTIRTCNPTLKSDVKLVTWRTVSDGTVWYRCYQEANDITDWYEGFSDTGLSDATLTRNERLYTTGGVLESESPVPYTSATIHDNRMFVASMERPRSQVNYTTKRVDFEAPWHSSALVVAAPEQIGGRIYALSSLSDKGIVFKKRAVLAFEGSGYTAIGGGTNYTDPYLLSPSIGCINPRSVVRYPQGVMFEASDGIWSLTQAMQMTPIGDKVRYYTDTHTITQAIAHDDQHRVLFLTSDGPALVYDWLHDAWSIYDNYTSTAGAVIDGQLYRLDSLGYIWSENTAAYDDNNSFVSMLAETAWINLGTIGNYGRLYGVLIFGRNLAAATLRVRLGYNHSPAWNTSDIQTVDMTALQTIQIADHYGTGLTWATYADQAMILRVYPDIDQQKCQSVRVQISDEQHTGQTAGYALTGIALEVGLRDQLYRVQAARQLGGP